MSDSDESPREGSPDLPRDPAGPDAHFGAELYEALKRLGLGGMVTSRFNYEAIQRLKAADRAGTAELFRGSAYVLIQRIKTGTPDEVATMLAIQAQVQARNAAILFSGLAFYP